ncbi:hypothetical protein Ahia01_001028200 [Argonauta hians]
MGSSCSCSSSSSSNNGSGGDSGSSSSSSGDGGGSGGGNGGSGNGGGGGAISQLIESSSVEFDDDSHSIVYDVITNPPALTTQPVASEDQNLNVDPPTPKSLRPLANWDPNPGLDPPQNPQCGATVGSLAPDVTLSQRFTQGIESYQMEKMKFTRDLNQFLCHHKVYLESAVWENITVDPYLLYSVVQHSGGYSTVTSHKKWADIYREVTNTFQKCRGQLVRTYYERNLLAFEMYSQGGTQYRHLVETMARRRRRGQKRKVATEEDGGGGGGGGGGRVEFGSVVAMETWTCDDEFDQPYKTPSLMDHYFKMLDDCNSSYTFEYDLVSTNEKPTGHNSLRYYDDDEDVDDDDGGGGGGCVTTDRDYQLATDNFISTQDHLSVPDITEARGPEFNPNQEYHLYTPTTTTTCYHGNLEQDLEGLEGQIEEFLICL